MESFIDLKGKEFGRWKVLRKVPGSSRNANWECECYCGTIKNVEGRNLRFGKSQSCGCLDEELMIGKTFNRLTVIKKAGSENNRIYWWCSCECGSIKKIPGKNLRTGTIKSCGCLQKEISSNNHLKKHGLSGVQEYRVWASMIQRCEKKNSSHYHRYGGRGITICERWRNDFSAFYKDMGPRPSSSYSIERIDLDGDYSPSNCKWATQKEQSSNRSDNRLLTAFGEVKTMRDWCDDERCSVSYGTLNVRVNRLGWDEETAITKKARKSAK